MDWSLAGRWLSMLLEPSPLALVLALFVAVSVPLFLHVVVFRSGRRASIPAFLLIGPSNSGKTSLLTLFERGQASDTHSSQVPLAVEVSLPVTTKTASSKYRSANDPTLQIHKRFLLIDTPGHGKLRYHALDCIHKTQNLKGIIFVVDAANLSSGSSGLRDAAEYLYNILLLLQNASSTSKVSKMQRDLPVLIAANKLDLFTSLPAPLVKSALESEITTIRSSRGKGLLDSTVGTNSLHLDQEKDFLGQDGQDKFEFSQMEDINVTVAIAGGSVIGGETYWDWIGQYL